MTEKSDLLFAEARRLRTIAATMPYYKSSYENRAREIDQRAWLLREREVRALMGE